MKKILLLIVSGLLIACMAGSAMAQNAAILAPDGDEYNVNPSPVPVGVPEIIGVKIWNIAASEYDYYPYSVKITRTSPAPTVLAPSDEVTAVLLKPGITLDALVAPSTTTIIEDEGVVSLVFSDKAVGNEYQVTVSVGDDTQLNHLVSATERYSPIPEFPTVALPVAAILGLVFIFGRKKEGL
jgi:hypothetical protein